MTVSGFSDPFGFSQEILGWERLHVPIWVFDPSTFRGLYANAPALELWGAETLEELLARDFSHLSPAVRSRTERLALATAKGATVSERWSFYPRGRPVTVQAFISTVPAGPGRTALLFEAMPVDLSEEELRAVEALRHTSSMISLFDPDQRPTFTNPAGFAAYGDADDFSTRFVDPTLGGRIFRDALDGHVVSERLIVRTAKGERHHDVDARQVTDPATGAVSVLLSERDVSAQVEAERALHDARRRADVAEAKERFLSNVSHELRTPLNAVIGFSDLLLNDGLDPRQVRSLDRIREAGRTLMAVVNNLIDLSELDGGRVTLEPSPFDIGQCLMAALMAVEPAASAKGLELSLEAPEGLDDLLVGDSRRIGVIVGHFLSNAVKFTPSGEVALALAASPAQGNGVSLEISVRDTGPGLAPAAVARLFERFGPGDDTTRKTVAGAGMGLAICKELAALMGGTVGAELAPGGGARFWLRIDLPFALGAEQARTGEDGRALSVLYADDHDSNRLLVKSLLESLGHSCDTAVDGAEAVRSALTGDYDIILMDIQMPVQDGVGATRAIRASGGAMARAPILAVTANTLSEQRAAYAAAGMNDCIAKPVDPQELLSKLSQWAGRGDWENGRAGSRPPSLTDERHRRA
jgi:signal transduction histidine kinase